MNRGGGDNNFQQGFLVNMQGRHSANSSPLAIIDRRK